MGPLVLMFGVAALAGIVGLTTARAEAVFLVGTIGIVVPIAVLAGRWAAPMLVVAALVAGFLASAVLFTSVPTMVLSVRGRPTTAVVATSTDVTVHTRSGTSHEWRYQLVDTAGRPIPGRLVATGPYWQPGDQVDVLVDPNGRIDPHEAGEADEWPSSAVIAGSLIAITAGLAVLAARRGRRPS